ncbi:RNA-binding protein [Oculatella sp. FACHB-28]|uniref:Jag family protein n=1 Tax=Cyanophyceae TaxID=3028117 RepID=UPI0016895956|nr:MULTISPECIES: R3H domain-containing nucleic acid-binding protein [Cyanophyceae]MBD2000234.1 RNA-binding protein [Leptolyngbya sp. FACHB-541]MBD2060420.1 RNA-binding protein [Oculatella sp. FACHB-28]
MDESQLRRGQEWLEKLLGLAGLPATVGTDAEQIQQEGSYWLVIDSAPLTSEQIETLVGADGSVLDAVQYLTNTTLNLGQPEDQQCAYTVELNGYRAKRQAELQAMAEQAAAKVRETGEEFEMVALSSAERRQVHTFLKPFEDLETYSRGREPDRRLVVRRSQS